MLTATDTIGTSREGLAAGRRAMNRQAAIPFFCWPLDQSFYKDLRSEHSDELAAMVERAKAKHPGVVTPISFDRTQEEDGFSDLDSEFCNSLACELVEFVEGQIPEIPDYASGIFREYFADGVTERANLIDYSAIALAIHCAVDVSGHRCLSQTARDLGLESMEAAMNYSLT